VGSTYRSGIKSGGRTYSRRELSPSPRPRGKSRSHSTSTSATRGNARRSLLVVASLVGVLTLTSVLLRAMQGAPLTPDAAYGLMASDSRSSLQVVFNTQVESPPSRWKAVYVHHSKTPAGNAASVSQVDDGCGDHFIIGNGNDAVDGEIQFSQRWNLQQSADPAPGVARVDGACISICVVGDFDRSTPTAAQLKRLQQLVQTLQERYRIAADQVWVFDVPASAAGVGKYFPTGAFMGQLLR
jgi:N-acetylmuramoyl-L-alanine amidase